VRVQSLETDNTSSYTYASSTFQPTNGGSGNTKNRVSWVDGLQQTNVTARINAIAATATAGAGVKVGVSMNSTGIPNFVSQATSATATLADNLQTVCHEENFPPQLGFNFIQGMENSANSVTATFYPLVIYSLILDGEY
jgi:hypothetical protein